MPGERDKAKENPYQPPMSSKDSTLKLRPALNAIERWIGFIILGIISIVAIAATAVVVLGLLSSLGSS